MKGDINRFAIKSLQRGQEEAFKCLILQNYLRTFCYCILLSLRQEDRSARQTHFQADGLISHSPFTPQLMRSLSIQREDHAREEPGKNCSAELQLLFFFFVLVLPYISMNLPRVYTCSPFRTLLPPPSPYHPSGSSQCTSPRHPVSCIKLGLAIRFIYDIIHVSMPFSQITPPSPSPSPPEYKRLFYTSVSLLLSRIQGHRYHLSKFHIYALVYCIGVFLSGLLHSV